MVLAASIMLFFLGARSFKKYREMRKSGEKISRRAFLWYFPVASFLLLADVAFFATAGFTFNSDSRIFLPIEQEFGAAFCGLAFMGIAGAIVCLPKDGWPLRAILIGWILLAAGWSSVMLYRNSHYRSSEQARFQQNLERCSVLLEQGKREELSGKLSGVAGSTLHELNNNFEDALRKIEVKP